MQQYINRVVIGLILFVFAFLISYYNAAIYTLIVLALSFLTIYEFKLLTKKMGIYPIVNWIYFFSAAFILLPLLVSRNHDVNSVYVFQVCILLSAYVVIFSKILSQTATTKFEDITTSLWAVLHLGLIAKLLYLAQDLGSWLCLCVYDYNGN